jgi:AmmeMemoRadiSam system protein B
LAYTVLESLADAIQHVVIIGPTHRVGIRAIALPDANFMATPLGNVAVWDEGVALSLDQPGVTQARAAHAEEHSLEVQLPFLQTVVPQADVLPLAVGLVSPSSVAEVLEVLWDLPGVFTVISSDLSHYHPYAEAQALDIATVQQILNRDPHLEHDQACGATGINAISLVAQSRNLRPRLLGMCNSGDTAGDKSGVVGYAALGFYEPGDSVDSGEVSQL